MGKHWLTTEASEWSAQCRRPRSSAQLDLFVTLPENGQVRRVLKLTGVERILCPGIDAT
jgi:hypothetical protein